MMSTLDLRGRPLEARALRTALPRAEFDVEAALRPGAARSSRTSVIAGAAALRDLGERFDGVRPTRLRVPPRCSRPPSTGSTPSLRAALEESIRRARLVHADQRRTDTTTQVVDGRHGHRAVGARRPGGPLRARRHRRLPRPASS